MSKLSEAIASVDGPEWDELLQVVRKLWHDYDWRSVVADEAAINEAPQVVLDPVLRDQLLNQVEVYFHRDRLPIVDGGLRRRAWEVGVLSAVLAIAGCQEGV